MKLNPPKRTPAILAFVVLLLLCLLQSRHFDFPERIECMTYDLRARAATHFHSVIATNLAFVAMEESSIQAVKNSEQLGYHYGLYWPRQIYGRIVEELAAQGAKAVAFDIQFGELRHDHPAVIMADGSLMESDDFFAAQMGIASNVIIAATPEVTPPKLFATNALALGDITTERDPDGILRRDRAFTLKWHPAFESVARQTGIDLGNAQIQGDRILLFTSDGKQIVVPLDRDGNFDLTGFFGDDLPKDWQRYAKPFQRVWHMGIVLAAVALKLDLAHADVDLLHGKIILPGANGMERIIPVDTNGFFYIDWQITPSDVRLLRKPIENLLLQDKLRLSGQTNGLRDDFRDKLVVVGSAVQANDLTDRGATPLENETLLVSKHWNVANSVISGRFIHRTGMSADLLLIVLLGALTAFMTWQLRTLQASAAILALIAAYIALTFFIYIEFRWWLPVVLPVAGAILIQHISLVTYRVMFEEREQRRVKSVFSRVVSPNVVHELLNVKKLSLGGARREVTIFFADVRGFTTLTDEIQQQVTEFVQTRQLDPVTAEKCFDESARETLETVNLYLAAVADSVKKHGGTLDKYIGDCVMAFWGAPTPNDKHASACIYAALEAQRAIRDLNEKRTAESASREIENRERLAAGLPAKPPLRALQLGTGINTGLVTVGLMGSDAHILNYTVFGREVNLASRLEGVSGSGRIIISDTTYYHLLREDPALAATCVELFPVSVKGIRDAVRIYEVPWQNK